VTPVSSPAFAEGTLARHNLTRRSAYARTDTRRDRVFAICMAPLPNAGEDTGVTGKNAAMASRGRHRRALRWMPKV